MTEAEELMNEIGSLALACELVDDPDKEERIREEARSMSYSVEVRSDWGCVNDRMEPGEFRIMLSGNGPTIYVRGEVDHCGDPEHPWLEVDGKRVESNKSDLLWFAGLFWLGV
jgi:hypothetical protein